MDSLENFILKHQLLLCAWQHIYISWGNHEEIEMSRGKLVSFIEEYEFYQNYRNSKSHERTNIEQMQIINSVEQMKPIAGQLYLWATLPLEQVNKNVKLRFLLELCWIIRVKQNCNLYQNIEGSFIESWSGSTGYNLAEMLTEGAQSRRVNFKYPRVSIEAKYPVLPDHKKIN